MTVFENRRAHIPRTSNLTDSAALALSQDPLFILPYYEHRRYCIKSSLFLFTIPHRTISQKVLTILFFCCYHYPDYNYTNLSKNFYVSICIQHSQSINIFKQFDSIISSFLIFVLRKLQQQARVYLLYFLFFSMFYIYLIFAYNSLCMSYSILYITLSEKVQKIYHTTIKA